MLVLQNLCGMCEQGLISQASNIFAKTDENLWRTKGQKDSTIIRLLNLKNSSGAIKLPKYSVPEHLKRRAGQNLNQI